MTVRQCRAAGWALILIAVIRVVVTFRTFSLTVDESTHIGAGLQIYQEHRYDFHRHNPPLPRLVMAAIPYWIGMRVNLDTENVYIRLLSVFQTKTGGKLSHKLVASRIGNLPFFVLACVGLWIYARRTLGEAGGLIALLLFVTQPIVLGYSCVATHDTAATAATAVAIVTFLRWLEKRDAKSAALFGLAYGFAILCKFSCIAYVPAACLMIFAVRLIDRRATFDRVQTLLVAVPVVCLVVWAGYGFSVRPVAEFGEYAGSFGPVVTKVMQHVDPRTPLPAPDFFLGIGLMQIDRGRFVQYLCGRLSSEGWWWYFPFAVLLKTPLPFLTLVVLGAVVVWRRKELRGVYVESMLATAVMIALAANSHLDLGIRYILPAYVPLTVAAAAAAIALPLRSAAAALVALHVIVSAMAGPESFAYFNSLAGDDPSKYLIDSNLDWGQDVLRLRSELRQMNVEHVAVYDSGLINYDYLDFPPHDIATAEPPRTGWVAVGDHVYRMGVAQGGYRWLGGLDYRRIGSSIRLYYVPARRR